MNISIKVLLNRLHRHPFLQDLSLDTVIDYTVDFMRIVGTGHLFSNKEATLKLDNYRVDLPCDFHSMNQVRYKDKALIFNSSSFAEHSNEDSYFTRGNVLFSTVKEGEITVYYKAIEIDDDGYPMIKDNSKFLRALESYIKKQAFTILFDLGKINAQVLNNAQQEYAFNVGQCQSYPLSIDEMEHFTKHYTSILDTRRHSKFFR